MVPGEVTPLRSDMASRTAHNNPKETGRLDLTYHYEMLADRARMEVFERAIQRTCQGKRVLDCGTGTGILALMAARAGAERVYGVDLDATVLEFAQTALHECGFSQVTFLHKDSRKITLDDLDGAPVEVVICENLSTWQVTEPEISVLNHVNVNLIADPVVHLPARVENLLQPVESNYLFHELVEVRTHYFEFTGTPPPRPLGAPVLYNEVHFTGVNLPLWHRKVRVKINRSGTLNGFRLTSPLQIHEELTFPGSDTLMPPVVLPLPHDLPVQAGDTVEAEVRYHHLMRWEDVRCAARLV